METSEKIKVCGNIVIKYTGSNEEEEEICYSLTQIDILNQFL